MIDSMLIFVQSNQTFKKIREKEFCTLNSSPLTPLLFFKQFIACDKLTKDILSWTCNFLQAKQVWFYDDTTIF